MARTGRRPGISGARERILEAARHRFAEYGLDGASMRDIAAEAGVDPALIHHYFGTKQRLFVAAVELPFDMRRLAPMLVDGPAAQTGERFIRLFLSIWEDPRTQRPLKGVLRSAITDQGAADLIRETLVVRIMGPLVESLGVPDPELRITLVASQMLGFALLRYVLAVEPLASADLETIVRAYAPTFQRYLLEPLQETAAV